MKLYELDKYIEKNELLKDVEENRAGIYCISLDKYPVYVGQSKNVYDRLKQHIYNVENAIFMEDEKYKFIYALRMGGMKLTYRVLEYCGIDELDDKEDEYISLCSNPIFNKLTPKGRQKLPTHIRDIIAYFDSVDKCVYDSLELEYNNQYSAYTEYHNGLLNA